MDITFCSVCNESIPQADLRGGRAVQRGRGVVCAACERAMGALPEGRAAMGAVTEDPMVDATAAGFAPHSPSATAPATHPPEPMSESSSRTPANVPEASPLAARELGPPSGARAAGSLWAGGLALGAIIGVVACWLVMDGRLADLQDRSQSVQLKVAQLEPLRAELERVAAEGRERRREDREAARIAQETAERRLAEVQGQLADARAALQSLARRADETDQLRSRVQVLEPLAPRVQDLEAKVRALGEERASLLARLDELGRGVAAAREASQSPGASAAPPAPPRPAWEGRLSDLKNPNEAVRLEAVLFLAESHDEDVVPHLVPMLRDENLFVRTATARALRDLKTKSGEALLALCDALLDEKPPVREAAWVALRACTGLDHAYDPLGSDAERARRARAWRESVEAGLQPAKAPTGAPGAPTPPSGG